MTRRFPRLFAAAVTAGLAGLFTTAAAPLHTVQAADSVSSPSKVLTISPSATKPNLKPGAILTGKLQIINQGQLPYEVTLYAAPYSVKTEAYTPDFSPIPGKPDASKWITLSTTRGMVTAGQTMDAGYTLRVPANTPAGGYYAVVFAQTKEPANKQGVVVNERVGEIFYVAVEGPVKQSGKILSWQSNFLQTQPLTATLRLENDGGVHYASDIQFVVRDMFGNPKYTLNTEKEILPLTIRRIPFEWKDAPPLGLFKVGGTATVLGQTEKLNTKYVLVMSPTIRIVVLILLGMLIMFYFGRTVGKRRRRKAAGADSNKSNQPPKANA